MICVLEERDFPVGELLPLASSRSVGKRVRIPRPGHPGHRPRDVRLPRAQIGLFSAGGEVSREYAPKAAAAGCIVIDNTSRVPLRGRHSAGGARGQSARASRDYKKRGIIANPNCSTIQMLVALKPIHDAVGIERINVATYQSVSGAGKEAVDELAAQTAALMSGEEPAKPKVIAKRIAFNVVPQIDEFHGQRLHQGRDEDGLGDPEDPGRPDDPGERDRGARAGVLRAFRSGAHRDPAQDHRRGGARAAAKRPRASR